MASGDELTLDLLPTTVTSGTAPRPVGVRTFDFESLSKELVDLGLNGADDGSNDLHAKIVDHVEREVISQVMTRCDGVQIKAATRLGINRNTLHKKLKEYGLESEAKRT